MGTNAVRPSGEAMTSCPVMPLSSTTATWRPAAGSMIPRVWSPLLATSRTPLEGVDAWVIRALPPAIAAMTTTRSITPLRSMEPPRRSSEAVKILPFARRCQRPVREAQDCPRPSATDEHATAASDANVTGAERAVRADLERPHGAPARVGDGEQGAVRREDERARRFGPFVHDAGAAPRIDVPDSPVTPVGAPDLAVPTDDELIRFDAPRDHGLVALRSKSDDAPLHRLSSVEATVGSERQARGGGVLLEHADPTRRMVDAVDAATVREVDVAVGVDGRARGLRVARRDGPPLLRGIQDLGRVVPLGIGPAFRRGDRVLAVAPQPAQRVGEDRGALHAVVAAVARDEAHVVARVLEGAGHRLVSEPPVAAVD